MTGSEDKTPEFVPPVRWTSRDVAVVLFRRKAVAAAFLAAVVAASAAYIFLTPEIYRSEAKLLVKIGRESATTTAT